jgi:RNA polymerase sigma factor (sigma-70 family)
VIQNEIRVPPSTIVAVRKLDRRSRTPIVNESILERVASGDQAAVAQCLDRYGGLVWSAARRWSDNAADAEDATQEIFIALWKSAARYKPSAGSEAAFISTIARRRMIDRLRAKGRRPSTEEFDESVMFELADSAPDQGMVAAEAAIAVRAVAQLEAGQQQVLMMGVVQGMTHSEIATATGKPLGTVKTQLRRGLIRVRELIEQGADSADLKGAD